MKESTNQIAVRLMNLYRAAHVIDGGWAAVNPVLVAEGGDAVIQEIKKLPTGEMLAMHISELRAGKIPMDSVNPELLPYGGMMGVHFAELDADARFENNDLDSLIAELEKFTPTLESIERIKKLPFVLQFGDRWTMGVRDALHSRPEFAARWKTVHDTARAYELWDRASDVLSWQPTERIRAEVQADLPEYETYLPMFEDAGMELLSKLRTYVASV
ncbi:MAG: hypothetical protein FWC83_00130 [Alphaproteobacteria bacterium]|nr:hypothetical protein [Alphaproteobacteria bacterium]